MSYVKIGVAGPVGSGKTALIEALSRKMANDYSIGVITNDIYTKEDAQRPSGGTQHRRGDRRLPAHRDPRGCFDEPRGRRRDDGAVPGHRASLYRERR